MKMFLLTIIDTGTGFCYIQDEFVSKEVQRTSWSKLFYDKRDAAEKAYEFYQNAFKSFKFKDKDTAGFNRLSHDSFILSLTQETGDVQIFKDEYFVRFEITEIEVPEPTFISVDTPAGKIMAEKSTDPSQPGICVVFNPTGFKCEVDAAYVAVYKDPETQTSDKERPEDLVIFTYGNVYDKDYTTKSILRREDVVCALSEDNGN